MIAQLQLTLAEVQLIHDALLDRSVRQAGPLVMKIERQMRALSAPAPDARGDPGRIPGNGVSRGAGPAGNAD